MKIEMTNKELFETIKMATNGNLKAKFEIIIQFQELIKKSASKCGRYKEECIDYIEDKIISNVEKFDIDKFLK